jgi:hypothetical protein
VNNNNNNNNNNKTNIYRKLVTWIPAANGTAERGCEIIKHHIVAYGGMDVFFHAFLTFNLLARKRFDTELEDSLLSGRFYKIKISCFYCDSISGYLGFKSLATSHILA